MQDLAACSLEAERTYPLTSTEQRHGLPGIPDQSIDFLFSFGVFVHCSFSTSAPVRYSRVRPTEEFAMVGGVVLSASKAMKTPIPRVDTEAAQRRAYSCSK